MSHPDAHIDPAPPLRDSWPRDRVTWVCCSLAIALVIVFVGALWYSGEPRAISAGPVVGLILALPLGARRTPSAAIAAPVVLIIAWSHCAWMMLIGMLFEVLGLRFMSTFGGKPEPMLAITAVGFAITLAFATRSWQVLLAVLASGGLAIIATRTPLRATDPLIPGVITLCLGVVLAPTLDTLLRARTAIAAHLCPHCNYDVRGLRTSICPECGKSTAHQDPA